MNNAASRSKLFSIVFTKIIHGILVAVLSFISLSSYAQFADELIPYEESIVFESQRYLMDEIFEVSTSEIDNFKVIVTLNEIDKDKGLMFVMTSYIFNDQSGTVLTSFNITSTDINSYSNIHFNTDEFGVLNEALTSISEKGPRTDEHFLKRINDELIIDVTYRISDVYYVFWINDKTRHAIEQFKWERAHRKHLKFIKVKKRDIEDE